MAVLHRPSSSFSVSVASVKIRSMASPLCPAAMASIAISKPSRLGHRKNHLRPKILRTLTKPNPSPLPITTAPLIVHEPTANEEPAVREDFSVENSTAVETRKGDELQLTSLMADDLRKFGAYFVACFIFQAIAVVWIVGSAKSNSRSETSKDVAVGEDEKGKGDILINGNGTGFRRKIVSAMSNAASIGEAEIESRIEEIRLLAREARRAERKELKSEAGSGEVDKSDALVSKSRTAVEKEIDSRLKRLEKTMSSAKESPVLSKTAPVKIGSSSGEMNGNLTFKKKVKFRSGSMGKPGTRPRGFSGSEGHSVDSDTTAIGVNVRSGSPEGDQTDGRNSGSGSGGLVSSKEVEVKDTESKAGAFHKPSQESSLVSQNLQRVGDEKQDTQRKSPSAASTAEAGSFKPKETGRNAGIKKVESKKKEDDTDLWWLKLPCVFAILMHRASDSEGPAGLYTVENASEETDESIPFIVGFEDRFDANNFLFLVEAFFEDLDDFSADIVPLLRKDLLEAAKDEGMRLIVVRKGQLRLYAGQPLSDAEAAIMSLVEDN